MYPALPKTREDNLIALANVSGTEGYAIVQEVSHGIVLIARDQDLTLFNKPNCEVSCDGTFKYSPRFFKQIDFGSKFSTGS